MIPNYEYGKFKGEKGNWRTQSLFFECHRDYENRPSPIYRLTETPASKLPCLRTIFIELNDPTEYKIATEYLGGWTHWQILIDCNFFKPIVEEWREELEVKLKCEELQKLLATPDKSFIEKKFIINKEWEVKRGRPSKEELYKRTKISNKVNEQIENDFKLIINEK